jgi:molecular chaperone DnaK (HSP70)
VTRTKKFWENKLVWILILLLAAVGVFTYVTLYNGGVVLRKTNSTEVISKLKGIQEKGGEFQLTQKDIDEISSLYFKKPKTKGKVTLHGVNVEMLEDELLIVAPMSYKKLNLLFTSRGKLGFSNGEVTYSAENFKIGKLTLPKNLVISQISKLRSENFYVEDNLIKINPSVFPFKINNFKLIDRKILGQAEKLNIKMLFQDIDKKSVEEIDKELSTVDKKIQSATVLMNEAEKQKIREIQSTIKEVKGKSIEEKKKVISDTINKLDKVIDKTTNSDKKKELEKIKTEVEKAQKVTAEKEKKSEEQAEIKRTALAKVGSELSGAYSQVENSKEQQIISIMLSTVSKMVDNPSYNSSSDQAYVRDIYSTLDPEARSRVKGAIFSSVAGDSIGELRQAFGM